MIMTQQQKKQLCRIPEKGKIAGVCAGVAEYTNMEPWLVRILWFTGLIFSGGFFFIAYIACWFILDKKTQGNVKYKNQGPKTGDQWHRFESERDIDQGVEVKTKVWQAGEPPRQAFKDIVRQYEGIEQRVRNMEGFVTSSEFTLKREINKL
jgi:phage shock protein C